MFSLMGSHGMALATAMAVSGTVILIALCRQKPLPAVAHLAAAPHRNSPSAPCNQLRSCIFSEERKRERAAKEEEKKKKRVHFAEEVVAVESEVEVEVVSDESSCCWVEELARETDEFTRAGGAAGEEEEEVRRVRQMPANRIALYNGILQDRLQRMACSY